MDGATRIHKERLLGIYQENLRELEIRAAKFGLSAPLYLINDIKDHRKTIDELRIQLRVNAEEVTLDQLLIGIESLQRIIHEEGVRVIKEYNQAFGDQAMLGFGLMAPIGGGILATYGLVYIYQTHIPNIYLVDQYNIIPALIYIVGITMSIYITIKLGKFISNSKYEWFVYRVGYDPFNRKRK